jgi:hypothetical protein
LIALYREYIGVRETMKAPLTETGLEKLIERAKRLSKNNVKVEKMLLEAAIINNWKNVYLPNEAEINAARQETVEELKSMFGLE